MITASTPNTANAFVHADALFIYIPVLAAVLIVAIMCFYRLDKEYDGIVTDLKEGRGVADND